MELKKLEVKGEYKFINILEITDSGENHRRFLTPDMDVSGEVQKIKDMAERHWTDEVKAAYAKNQEDAIKNRPLGAPA